MNIEKSKVTGEELIRLLGIIYKANESCMQKDKTMKVLQKKLELYEAITTETEHNRINNLMNQYVKDYEHNQKN